MKKRQKSNRVHEYPTQDLLRKIFNYHSDDIESYLFYRVSRGKCGEGAAAGTLTYSHSNLKPNRKMIKINGVMFNARELIWIYHNGPVPECGLKYRDGNHWNHKVSNIVPRKPVVSFM